MSTQAKPRRRRFASDEAHAWARNLQLRNPYAKSVLRAIALYTNDEGSCIAGIPTLADDTDLSEDTVRKRLKFLEEIGAIVRLPRWLDENGRSNTEGRGKRTTDDIRMLIDADVDAIEARARGEDPDDEGDGEAEFSPRSQQGLNHAPETVSPVPVVGQPSHCSEGLTSEPEPESSPQPPSGGSPDIEGWKEFEADWEEAILRQSLAQQVWAALSPAERLLARAGARGYVASLKSQRKPPNRIGAHLFLRERDAWSRYATQDPAAKGVSITGVPVDSAEGKALAAMYAVARSRLFENQKRYVYRGEITPQVQAFADAPARSDWVWIDGSQQLGAWSAFLAAHVFGARPPMLTTRGVGPDQRTGIYAPWPWPPRKDGSLSTAPPEGTLSDQDAADFK